MESPTKLQEQVNFENQAKNKNKEVGLEVVKEEEVKESKGKKYVNKVFSINTSMCRSELELIQYIITKNGFMETTNPNSGNLYWFGLALTSKDLDLV